MDLGPCPVCARSGKMSKLEYILSDEMNLILCERSDCSYTVAGKHIRRKRQDSPLSPHLMNKLSPKYCPPTLLSEPRLKYRHLMKLFWLIEMRKVDIYLWLQEEVGSMIYSRLRQLRRCDRYQLTPSAKRLLELTDEEVQIGKHIIPDLRRIVTTLKVQYQIHLATQG